MVGTRLLPPPPPPNSEHATNKGIAISLGDRWLIAGTTGTGKTTFCKVLISRLHAIYPTVPVYILDSKQADDFRGWKTTVKQDAPPPTIREGIQIWQPGLDDKQIYDEWFGRLLHADGPAIVLIDEISSVSPSNMGPPNFQRLLKQGRGLRKCVLNCTQEMAYTPRQIVTQTTHIIRFRLGNQFDQDKANKLLGREAGSPEPSRKHGFFYARTDQPGVLEYPDYHDFLR